MQWTKVCISFRKENFTATVTLVVDGQILREENLKMGFVVTTPLLVTLPESSGLTTNFNVFSTCLTKEEMTNWTSAEGQCGEPGDFLNWAKTEWTLKGGAQFIEFDQGLEGPCRRDPKVHVFPMIGRQRQSSCMDHCKKLGERSPPVRTFSEWRNLHTELGHLSPNPYGFALWLSITKKDTTSATSLREGFK